METSVTRVSSHACKRIAWIATGSFEDCDFRDNEIRRDFKNRVKRDFYNFVLDEIKPSMRLI
jgi:hypothetical protein